MNTYQVILFGTLLLASSSQELKQMIASLTAEHAAQ